MFVYKVLPYFVIRTNWFMPEWASAITYWMFILVKKDHKITEALIEHEKVHVRQQYKYTPILFAILYFGFDSWRLKFEIEAYTKNIEHGVDNPERIAKILYTKYKINHISYVQILKQLKDGLTTNQGGK